MQIRDRFAEALEAFAQLGQKRLAGAGQFEAPLQASEQPQPQDPLQPLDLVAYRGRGDVQLPRRRRKASMARSRLESA